MMGFLAPFLGGWRLYAAIGAIVAVALIGSYIAVLRASNAALQAEHARLSAELDTAARAAADNARALARARSEHIADMMLLEHHAALRLEAAVRTSETLEEIGHAPDSDDGPVAPVLRRALDRLRGTHGHGDAGRSP